MFLTLVKLAIIPLMWFFFKYSNILKFRNEFENRKLDSIVVPRVARRLNRMSLHVNAILMYVHFNPLSCFPLQRP